MEACTDNGLHEDIGLALALRCQGLDHKSVKNPVLSVVFRIKRLNNQIFSIFP